MFKPSRKHGRLRLVAAMSIAAPAPALAGPEPRSYSGMAYDSARGVCVLYGGVSGCEWVGGTVHFTDTWEWDGLFWSQRHTPTNPGLVPTPAMVFDTARGVSVLQAWESETWEYAAGDWRLVSTERLYIPFGHSMTYDSRRGVTVLHGGWINLPNPPGPWTWEWGGQHWSLVQEGGPNGFGDAMVFHESLGVSVDIDEYGTWTWDGQDWAIVATGAPSNLWYRTACYDSARRVVVLFGSDGTGPWPCRTPIGGETWEWDGAAWTRRDAPGPAPRFGPVMAYDRRRGVSVLFGGWTAAGVTNETWEWDGTRWTLRGTCYPDCDTSTGQGRLDVFDYLCFQNEFAAGQPYACDCDTSSGPEVCDVFDFLCFQNRFVNGCR